MALNPRTPRMGTIVPSEENFYLVFCLLAPALCVHKSTCTPQLTLSPSPMMKKLHSSFFEGVDLKKKHQITGYILTCLNTSDRQYGATWRQRISKFHKSIFN